MQSQAARDYGLAHGHPPVAAGTILVDFDGTLFPWDDLFAENPPVPGAVDAMRRLKAHGYTIYIYTSRMSDVWLEHEGQDVAKHDAHVRKMLDRYGIPYDGITANKRPAVAYIDDNAERLECYPDKKNPKGSNWKYLADKYAPETHEHEWYQDDGDPAWVYCYCGAIRFRQDDENPVIANFEREDPNIDYAGSEGE